MTKTSFRKRKEGNQQQAEHISCRICLGSGSQIADMTNITGHWAKVPSFCPQLKMVLGYITKSFTHLACTFLATHMHKSACFLAQFHRRSTSLLFSRATSECQFVQAVPDLPFRILYSSPQSWNFFFIHWSVCLSFTGQNLSGAVREPPPRW